MQYLFSVITDGLELADADEQEVISAFNTDRLIGGGYWVFAGGLGSTSTATVIDNRHAEPIVTDGPYVETKEHVAGLWIIDAPDLDVALELATEASRVCNRKIEIRPFL